MNEEILESIKRALLASNDYLEQKQRLTHVAEIYEISLHRVICLASSIYKDIYKKKEYKRSKQKSELIKEISIKLQLSEENCESLEKVNKFLLIKILERLQ